MMSKELCAAKIVADMTLLNPSAMAPVAAQLQQSYEIIAGAILDEIRLRATVIVPPTGALSVAGTGVPVAGTIPPGSIL